MDTKTLNKANKLVNEMYSIERDIEDIDRILDSEKNPQITIQITVDGWSRSFGGKKYDMIGQIKLGLISLKYDLHQELLKLKEEFDKLK